MTKKENLLKVLRCEEPEWVPFALGFKHWFDYHQHTNSLPDDLKKIENCDYIDAMKFLGCDILARNFYCGQDEIFNKIKHNVITNKKDIGIQTINEYETPFGSLSESRQEIEHMLVSHEENFIIKEWEKDRDAAMYILDNTDFTWREEVFLELQDKIGDDGICMIPCWGTPLKWLHWKCGLQNSCFFFMDYMDQVKEYCDLFWEKSSQVLRKMAEHPEVKVMILMDNVDAPFYGGFLADELWTPYVKNAMDICREHGKFLFVHACGQLANLKDAIAESKVTGLEGVSHGPIGDLPIEEAKKIHPEFIFNGGFSNREQLDLSDDEVKAFYTDYLNRTGKDRTIIASSCSTIAETKWERMKLVRDIVREWGGWPK